MNGKLVGFFLVLLIVSSTTLRAQTVEEATAEAQRAKLFFEAEKAKFDAEAAAAKAKFGTLAEHTNAGGVVAGAGAGKLEASLLGTEATLGVAKYIATAVCDALKTSGAAAGSSAVFVVAEGHVVSFEAFDAFLIQTHLVAEQLSAALVMKASESSTSGKDLSGRTSAATILAIAGNLFRSEYSVNNIDLSSDDNVLTRAVIHAATCRTDYSFHLPGQYIAPTHMTDNRAMIEMRQLDELRRQLQQKQLTDTRVRSDGLEAAKAEKDKAKAAQLREAAERYDLPIDAATKALEAHAGLRNALSTPDDKGVLPLSLITRQAHLAATLAKDGYLLVLKANVLGGTSYTKKNFWTFLGSMPFSVTGGATASYTLIDGNSSNVIDSGVVARSAPYAKVHRTIARFQDGVPRKQEERVSGK